MKADKQLSDIFCVLWQVTSLFLLFAFHSWSKLLSSILAKLLLRLSSDERHNPLKDGQTKDVVLKLSSLGQPPFQVFQALSLKPNTPLSLESLSLAVISRFEVNYKLNPDQLRHMRVCLSEARAHLSRSS